MAGTEERQVELITNYFKKMFSPTMEENEIKIYPPAEMIIPFNGREIEAATKGLKNGKSAGADNLHAEYIKYADSSVHENIAHILNEVAKTGNHPEELKLGLLTPVQKPNKKQKEPEILDHLRPIMLLSVLRKILTICIIQRTWTRMKERIPHEQAAYQGGRSTTEQVLAVKLLAEKAINSSDYTIFLSLFDMSKAFDTVNRKKLFEHLENILTADELHLLSIITNTTRVRVKVNKTLGDVFITLIGIMQGDCLSALLFIFYLSECLRHETNRIERSEDLLVKPKYADDITYATKHTETTESIKKVVPEILQTHNLMINHTKTEEFVIPKPPPPSPPPPTLDTLLAHKNDKILWSELDWLVNYTPLLLKTTHLTGETVNC